MFGRILAVGLTAVIAWAVFAHASEGRGHEQRYRVKPYDTLWSIAVAHYAGDVRDAIWKIERRNGLSSALLRPGQTLVLP